MHLGEVDTSVLAGNFVFAPLISEVYWEVEIQDFLINGATASACGFMK